MHINFFTFTVKTCYFNLHFRIIAIFIYFYDLMALYSRKNLEKIFLDILSFFGIF